MGSILGILGALYILIVIPVTIWLTERALR
jgi:hypothetical protein